MDPLLRARVWEYLRELVASSDTTVIITTHYIDEARHAHTVGMMRYGRCAVCAPGAVPADVHALGCWQRAIQMR